MFDNRKSLKSKFIFSFRRIIILVIIPVLVIQTGDGQAGIDLLILVDESGVILGQPVRALGRGIRLDVVPLLTEPVVTRSRIIHALNKINLFLLNLLSPML